MPGNEMAIVNFLFNNLGNVSLDNIGIVNEIGAPSIGAGLYTTTPRCVGHATKCFGSLVRCLRQASGRG
jgi:hypothetical protein